MKVFSLATAHQGFQDGVLKDPALAKLLDRMVGRWVAEGKRLSPST